MKINDMIMIDKNYNNINVINLDILSVILESITSRIEFQIEIRIEAHSNKRHNTNSELRGHMVQRTTSILPKTKKQPSSKPAE